MINNDNEFQKAFNKYLKSKGIKGNEEFFCGRMNCDDCPYKYKIACKESLLDDLLQNIEWLNYENKALRHTVIDLVKESEQLKQESKKLLESKR